MENLNYFDIFAILFMIIFVIEGYSKGLFLIIITIIRSIVGYFLCFFASARLTPIVYENYVETPLRQELTTKLSEFTDIDTMVAGLKEGLASMPSIITDSFDTSKVETLSNDSAIEYIMTTIAEPLANFAIRILVFSVVFALFFILTSAIIVLVKKVRNKSKGSLKSFDRISGAALGFVKWGIIAMVFVTIINFISPYVVDDSGFLTMCQASKIFTFVSQNNLVGEMIGGNLL